ncbi:MAG TPA: 4-hydroxythreonine-4-phosphate dehydrogenase PdxA [Sphingomonas sp.]|jgi:4-hydroxythreonine-4-phosphate dehydrogenase|nr:4-hydroxythreonine-4-phosphate dehydrogenase PdxA [Sphingomonas sp.]
MPPLAVSMGDPAGIGPEIIGKAWEHREAHALPSFVAIADLRAIAAVWHGPIVAVGDVRDAAGHFATALPVIDIGSTGAVVPGSPHDDGARAALTALEHAIAVVRAGEARALVTGPVSKAQMYGIGFTHPGQTEFVADRCGIAPDDAVMMLAGPSLKVVPLTVHVPLAAVPGLLSIASIVSRARITAAALRHDFGIAAPRLAFAGFNPHAGESGALGREEIDILAPAIALLRAEGIDAIGPLPADTMFHARAREGYDAALCCYHDQALVPIKTLDFDQGVNITLGLPIVRTSPDHGTAFGIAGKGLAHPGAMIAAIIMAGEAAARRAGA